MRRPPHTRRTPAPALAGLALLALLAALPAGCEQKQSGETDRQILQQLAVIQDDLDEVKEQLALLKDQVASAPAPAAAPAARPPRPTVSQVPVQTAGFPSLGRKDAPVTLVEFSDFQCPFCRRHFASTWPSIKKDYVDTGKVRYVFVDSPLPGHRYAAKAAEAAHCAGDQDDFWPMHDHLFENQHRITPENLQVFATEIGLDAKAFKTCMDTGKHASEVQAGARLASAVGAGGTPSFVVGKTRPDGTVSGDLVVGAKALPVFTQLFAKYLGG